MKDIIWTLIVVWLIYKVINIFRSATTKRVYTNNNDQNYTRQQSTNAHNSSKPEKDIKDAVKKHLNNEGEYIDFEEVK